MRLRETAPQRNREDNSPTLSITTTNTADHSATDGGEPYNRSERRATPLQATAYQPNQKPPRGGHRQAAPTPTPPSRSHSRRNHHPTGGAPAWAHPTPQHRLPTATVPTQKAAQQSPVHNRSRGAQRQATDAGSDGGRQHQAQASGGATPQHHSNTPQPEATAADGGGAGGGQQQPVEELEEVPVEGESRNTGGTAHQKPYHEGRGDQRMRGKRFKSAVQAAFQQRGWTKDEDETWKGVAHLVGMDEEDEEESWAQILSRGPQPGEPRTRPDRRQGEGTQGGPSTQPDWSAVLNLHTKPRGSVTPEELQQLQRPGRPQPSTAQTTAEGGPTGEPRRRQPSDSTATQQQPSQRRATAAGDPRGEPRRRQPSSSSTTQHLSTMTLSAGGAAQPRTFPPEIPAAWGVDVHFRYLGYGAWAGVTMATGSRRAPEYRNARRGYYRAMLQRRPGGLEPTGYMSISTAFVLFPWGKVQRGHPVKWLLHITGAQAQPDPEAAVLTPGSSFTLERKPGKQAWELGGLPPTIGLQYYYDWGHMQGTGAIYERLPRSYTMPPSQWEEMGARLIPPAGRQRHLPPNPHFEGDDPHNADSRTAASSSSWGTWPGPTPTTSSSWSPSPSPPGHPQTTAEQGDPHPEHVETAETYGQNDWQRDDGDPDHTQLMQSRSHLSSKAASSSHGPRVLQIRGIPRLTGAAAMIRRWLREFAAILRNQPMGEQVPLLLQQAMEAVGHDQETEDEGDNGTVGIPGPCKKRRVLNMLYVARARLEDVTDDDGVDGLNQHQIRADLEEALRDVDRGALTFEQLTAQQWGDQVQEGHHGIEQARRAIRAAIADTVQGDLDWVTPGWGQAIRMVLQEAEELIDEEGLLDYTHPSDVLALDEGATEAPPQLQGSTYNQVDTLLRNVGSIAHFLRKGREELRRFMAAVIVWRQANHAMESIAVDTQSTQAAEELQPGDPSGDPSGNALGPGPGDPTGDPTGEGGQEKAAEELQPEDPTGDSSGKPGDPTGDPTGEGGQATRGQQLVNATRWIPPLHAEQWSGSIPTEDTPPSEGEEPVYPTDEELVQALEEYERQAEEERLQEGSTEGELAEGQPEWAPGASTPEGHTEPSEHKRRRILAATLADSGDGP